MPARRKRLTKPEVVALISDLTSQRDISEELLYGFAEKINGGPFTTPKPKKPKTMTMAAARKAVLAQFNCTTVPQLRKNKTFSMAMTGEKISFKSKSSPYHQRV